MYTRITIVFVLAVTAQTIVAAEGPKTVRLLTIGNSFADNALEFLPGIVGATENKLIYARANLGGCTLQRHWNHVEKFEADPNGKEGSPYGQQRFSLADRLQQDKWDFVTIQQVSLQSHDLSSYRPYAKNLHGYIQKHSPQAEILLHQIWAYRVDDKRFTPNNAGKQPHTQAVMFRQVRDAYHTIAKELNVGILPSGDAMYLADTDEQWGYKVDGNFDFAMPVKPALPDQTHSLHVGWRWVKQKDETSQLQMDGHHASKAGKFLIGCVWYEVLFGQTVIDNTFLPQGLDAEYAGFLRATAHQAVVESQRRAAPTY